MDPRMKQAFGGFRRNMVGLMRAQLAQERRMRAAKIKSLKGMIKRIEAAMSKPHSKGAIRNLTAVKRQLAKDLSDEVTKLAARAKSAKRTLSRIGRSMPWGD